MLFKLLLLYCLSIGNVYLLDNGLVKKPPMGWLSWESFGCQTKCNIKDQFSNCISENLFIQIADALVSNGYRDAGYDRVNIDDCWSSKSRDVTSGKLEPDPVRFPNGIKYLSDYMHKNGLKLGIYQNLGRRTCMNYPGITGHMKVDVKTFMEWDVDMIKLDACFTATTTLNKGYINFGRLLNQSPKPIVYSCSWPYYQVHASQVHIVPNWDLISHNCNLFRVFHDIHPDWKSLLATIDFMSDNQEIFRRITGPGSWPDPDMLLIGDSGLSFGEAKAQMAVWCIFPAPLFMSNDPRTIDSKFKSILLNREAIAINQDELTIPGERIFHNQTMDIWRRLLSNNTVAFVVLNRQNDLPIDLKLPIEQVASIVNNTSEIQVFDVFKAVSSSFHIKLNSLNWFDVHVEPKTVTFLRMQPLTII